MKNLASLKDYDAAKRSVFILDENGRIIYRWVSDSPLIEPNYEEIKGVLKKAKN
jgi:peroxiredoxin